MEVYESLLLGSNAWLSGCLASLFYILAIINVTFTSFVAFEQISMFYKELLHKEESIRVQRFLTIKNRPIKHIEQKEIRVTAAHEDPNSKAPKRWIIAILMFANALLCMSSAATTDIVITAVGSFTSPLVLFVLPGFLFYHYSRQENLPHLHRRLSVTFVLLGVSFLVVMTTISFFVIR